MKLADYQKLDLPDTPGVYFFLNKKVNREEDLTASDILYIGKATSLKSRVRSYFDDDILHTRGLHISSMVSLAEHVFYRQTRSVLESLLLEKELIKKFTPKYNTKEKDDKSYFVLAITEEDFPRVLLFRQRTLDKMVEKLEIKVKKTFGPYTSGEHAREALKLVRKIFPFRDKCEVYKKSQIGRGGYNKNKCFSFELGLCPGVCQGLLTKKQYQKHINRLVEFLEGDGEKVRQDLEKDMKEAAASLEFEEAQRIKEVLFSLEHIRDAHLIHRDNNEEDSIRIEGYDVAHLSGSSRVGVMTVVSGGIPAKSMYKKFKLTKDINDDLEGLTEILGRRLAHLEDWGVPDLIVVDGDGRHVRVAEKLINSIEQDAGRKVDVGVVAVTKDKSHKASQFVLGSRVSAELVEKYKRQIVLVNSEAHRFSIRYHRELRQKNLLGKKV